MDGLATRDEFTTSPPPRPEKLTCRVDHEGDELTISVRAARGFGAFFTVAFLTVWLSFWSVGCVILAGGIIKQPSLAMVLFSVPFFGAWFVVASLILWILFGRVNLVLTSEQIELSWTALIQFWKRQVPVNDVLRVREFSESRHNSGTRYGIEIETTAKPLRFGKELPNAERAWLISVLVEVLNSLRDEPLLSNPEPQVPATSGSLLQAYISSSAIALSADDGDAPRPVTSSWQREDDFGAIVFRQRGRLSWSTLGVTLLITLFWNGIVSLFVMVLWEVLPGARAPQGVAWWGLFFFLIPFEIIGLTLLSATFMVLIDPLRRTTVRIEDHQIVRSSRWLFIRSSKRWPIDNLKRVEIRESTSTKTGSNREATPKQDDRFVLALIGPHNDNAAKLTGLTQSEARWMGQTILRERADWFRD